MLHYPDLIKTLDHRSNPERRAIILSWLQERGIAVEKHAYATGVNLIVDLGEPGKKRIGVSSHYDRVKNTAGANDNSSAIAVCLDLVSRHRALGDESVGLRIFFFDEEETGLQGSTAYVQAHGIDELSGLINLEMVGKGEHFALWPVNDRTQSSLLGTFEAIAREENRLAKRFDQIVTNTADHLPFQLAGLDDCFTITCISDKDIEVAAHYYKALEFDVDQQTLFSILAAAPLFQHYHQPTDTWEKLSEESLRMTSSTIWSTILRMQRK